MDELEKTMRQFLGATKTAKRKAARRARKEPEQKPLPRPKTIIILSVRRADEWPPYRKEFPSETMSKLLAYTSACQAARKAGYIVHAWIDTVVPE